jgi:hypothetical protein
MAKQKITNTFNGGLNWDNHIAVGDNNDYRYALNIINSDEEQNSFKSNEHSNREVASFSGRILGKKYITQLASTIFFIEGGEVHLYHHAKEELKLVAKASEFGCDWGMIGCEWINIHNYYQYINDLWITYSSNKVYYNLNLTELLDPKRKAGLITSLSSGCGEGCSQRTCDYFKVFKKVCDPHIEAIVLDGGTLRNGTYFIGGRYLNNQGGYSNPFIMTEALHVGGNDNIPGEISNKRIQISVRNTSCIFDQIEFFVHEIIDSKTLTKALPVQYITGDTFDITYTGSEQSIPIDMAELLVNSRIYIEGEDLIIHDNKAIYYRTTPEFEYNFQPIANQIETNWYAVKVPMADVKKYNIKSFYRGETYAFSVTPNYTTGKKGYGFHISGSPGGGNCASFPYIEPEEEVHITGGKTKQTPGNAGSDNPAQAINGKISLIEGGCSGEIKLEAYLDTDNYCTATKLYTTDSQEILLPAGVYKLDYSGDSFVREWDGENFTNPCVICLGSSQGGGGGSCSSKPSTSGSIGTSATSNVDIKIGILYKRLRSSVPATVNNPSDETFIQLAKGIVDSWQTTNQDIVNAIGPAIQPDETCIDCGSDNNVNLETTSTDCEDCTTTGNISGEVSINVPFPKDELNQFANVKNAEKDKAIAAKDAANAEEIGALWYNALSNYIYEEKQTANQDYTQSDNKVKGSIPAQLLKNPVQAIQTLREGARDLINAVERRERFSFSYDPVTINKNTSYDPGLLTETNDHSNKPFKSTNYQISYNEDGSIKVNDSHNVEVLPGVYKKYPIIARGKTTPKVESNTYPCIVDCYGNQIYCGLGGSPVIHHTFPTNAEIPFWVPHNVGDGSTYQSDSSIMDGYAIILGVEFSNINIPDNIKGYLCATNPLTFGVVKRDSTNASIILKGLGTEMYTGQNQGKTYLYYKYSLNSMEKVSKYIDSDGAGTRFGGTTDDTNNINLYSLDQLLRGPYLNGTHIVREGTFKAKGARHSLYNKGLEQKDNRARRRDISGSIHTMMIDSFSPSNSKFEIQGQIYAEPNQACSPEGGSIPFMNKSGQSCAWITANGVGRGINDDSFVGDVLQDKAPITNGEADYFSIVKEMDSQYGDITSLNYVPILQARGFDQSVRGLVGDVYIGVHSFVKTGYVSDKVGNFFPVGNMVPSKVDRSICDCPDDAVHSLTGNWYWKRLPIDGDAADAKRWSGTHTADRTKTWAESRMTPTESHYYYPATTKALIEYVGEFEANPWLRQKSNLLKEQVPNMLKPIYDLYPANNAGGDWTISYLALWNKLIEQASAVQLGMKVLILSFINLALPLFGIEDWANPETGIEFAGDMVSSVIQIGVWLMISQVLFTNDFVDKFLRLDTCKRDEEGGEEQFTQDWFENYTAYNNDYSIDYFYPTIKGLPLEYTGCMATSSVTNTYYISDINDVSYYVNGYQVVRPNSKVHLEETYGKITKMYAIGGSLFIHTTGGIYKTQSGQVTTPTSVGDILLGSSSLLTYPQLITNTSDEGLFGLQHPNHGMMTDKGFLFVDYNAKQIILFTGSNFDVLSGPQSRMESFFKQYLNLCNKDDCSFEYREDTPNFIFGIDNRYNRLLFTKVDKDASYTLSYDIGTKRWQSFHSYVPQLYHNDRNMLYTIKDNKLYRHDVYDTFTTYYGEFKGIILDFTCTLDQDYFNWSHAEIFTEAKRGFIRDRDITFNQVAMVNNWQSTGYLDLDVRTKVDDFANDSEDKIKDKITRIDLTRLPSSFRFNEVFDYTVNHEEANIIYDDCKPEPILQNYGDYLDRNDQSYTDRIVSDNYQYYRFIFNTFADVKLYIKKIETAISRQPY